ncbi:MAG TPA: histidine kinase dimerization/phospho-acceptor domain-containing protein, partial [Chloroflexota bacterium]|nr:histidine kinase dimerization/phospho-acceptor domain-containing protein [Chloroflexota bacterium]
MAAIGALEREPAPTAVAEAVAGAVPESAPEPAAEAVPEPAPAPAQALLDVRERFAFERGMQRLRLTFLASPILVCASFGWAALPFAVQIAAVTLGSYAVIALALRRAPRATLRWQLALRVLDCLLAYFVLLNYHAFLGNAYYDSVYALFTVAAAATQGRRGALLIGTLSGLLVLVGRLQLVAAGVLDFQIRHVTDGIYYAIFYSATGLAVAHLMRLSGRVVERRERDWREQLAVNNATLLEMAHRLRTSNAALADGAARLEAANKELEAFAYSVSHDLRAPLRSIDGFSRIVADTYAERLDERGRDYLGRVRAAAKRMGELIDGLLGLSRLTRAPLRVGAVDLAALARAAANELQERDPQRSVTWIIPEHVPARGDEGLLRALFENLLGNAWKFTARHPSAVIEFGEWR